MCHVANRALSDVEARYRQTELKAVTIKFACADTFHKHLVGAQKFEITTLITNHLRASLKKSLYIDPRYTKSWVC